MNIGRLPILPAECKVSKPMGRTCSSSCRIRASPARAVIRQVQAELAATPELQQGGVLIVDESADEKASDQTVGAGRQHNGRLGKIEMSQVGTFLGFAKGTLWTWIDGELFLPEAWFGPDKAPARQRLGVPLTGSSPPKLNSRGR